jgi:hypothetical protein
MSLLTSTVIAVAGAALTIVFLPGRRRPAHAERPSEVTHAGHL